MAKNTDPQALFQDFLNNLKIDTTAFEDVFKNTAEANEKLAAIALDAAGKSAKMSADWTDDTIAKLADISKAKAEPAEYAKALSDFASEQASATAEKMAAFAELAKKVQTETVDFLVEAGKDLSAESAAQVKKATKK